MQKVMKMGAKRQAAEEYHREFGQQFILIILEVKL